jgi:hypothetical protein
MSKNIVSVSRIPIVITVNNDVKLKGELTRHLSPLTIKKIINNLPLSQLINNFHNKFIYVKSGINGGLEKPQNIFKKGDIAYLPISDCIYIFLTDYIHNNQFNRIGIITDSLKELTNTKAGDILNIQRV